MRLGLTVFAAWLLLASGVHGAVTQRSNPGLAIVGAAAGDQAGSSVAISRGSVLVGAPMAHARAGAVYIVGGRKRGRLKLGAPNFKGAAPGDQLGLSVAAAGDVNGDGVDDVILGAPGADPSGRTDAGSAYVIFGGGSGPADLGNLGSRGFRIDGPAAFGKAGTRVAAAGDLNGDGRADLMLTAPRLPVEGTDSNGKVFVVYGKPDSAPVDLASPGTGGFVIQPSDFGLAVGSGIAGGTDLSGDRVPDLAAGMFISGDEGEGELFTVFGGALASPVGVGGDGAIAPPAQGWRAQGGTGDASNGVALAETADMNGDGRGELVAGAPGDGCSQCKGHSPSGNKRTLSGSAYVVFGQPAGAAVNFNLSFAGFKVFGARPGAGAGSSLAAAGDMNGDGVPDFALGAPGPLSGVTSKSHPAGATYIVYGKRSRGSIDLGKLGTRGFELRGGAKERLGESVAAGPLGSDRADLAAGAPAAGGGRGTVYVATPMGVAISDHPSLRAGGGVLRIRVKCLLRSRCKGSLVVRRGTKTVGREHFSIGGRKRVAVGVPITAHGHLSAAATVRAPGGLGSSTATATFFVK